MRKAFKANRKNSVNPINRGVLLKDSFNEIWNKSLKTNNEDYYSKLTGNDLISLKCAISCVNNIITLKTTIAFIDYLSNNGIIDPQKATEIRTHVQETNANTNGFDIETNNYTPNIIAEVKCNKPVNENSFGPAQVDGILNDLKGLAEGKTKSQANVNDCLKFMVLLRLEAVEESMKQVMVIFNSDSPVKAKEIDNEEGDLSKDSIYVVYIDANLI